WRPGGRWGRWPAAKCSTSPDPALLAKGPPMHRILLLAGALALTGCAGDPKPLAMAGTPESSRSALVAALDAWKAGKSFQDLVGQSPSLIFQDDDLNRGTKLLDYQVEGNGQPRGTGYSYVVTLTLQDKSGAKPPARKKVAYTAVTEPNHAVTREDRQP